MPLLLILAAILGVFWLLGKHHKKQLQASTKYIGLCAMETILYSYSKPIILNLNTLSEFRRYNKSVALATAYNEIKSKYKFLIDNNFESKLRNIYSIPDSASSYVKNAEEGKYQTVNRLIHEPVRVMWIYTSPAGRNRHVGSADITFEDLQRYKEDEKRIKNPDKIAREIERKKVTPALRYTILKRDNFKCQICGRTAQDGVVLEVDHKKPIAKGGKTELDNLWTLCKDCNRGKGIDNITFEDLQEDAKQEKELQRTTQSFRNDTIAPDDCTYQTCEKTAQDDVKPKIDLKKNITQEEKNDSDNLCTLSKDCDKINQSISDSKSNSLTDDKKNNTVNPVSNVKNSSDLSKNRKILDEEFLDFCKKGFISKISEAINAGVNINAKNKEDKTALIVSVEDGCLEVVHILINAGADVNTKDTDGDTPLIKATMKAYKQNNLAVINMLLKAGADVNAKNNDGYTALMWAASINAIEVAKVLIKAGANVNDKDNDGCTILMWAAFWGCIDVINMLIEAGADDVVTDNEGKTALIYAAMLTPITNTIIDNGTSASVIALIGTGADVKHKDNSGKMAIDYARKNPLLRDSKALRRLEKLSA